MDGENVFHTLDLEDQHTLNNQIEAVATVKLDTLIFHRKWNLSLEADATKVQFVTETFFVRRFQKPWAERPMYLDRRSNDTFGQLFMKKFAPCLRVSVVNHDS